MKQTLGLYGVCKCEILQQNNAIILTPKLNNVQI